MNTLLFLDTETTGLEDIDRVTQVAYKVGDDPEVRSVLCRPPLEISKSASSVSHITDEMVQDLPAFPDTILYDDLSTLIDDGAIVVAHNAPFDLRMLAYEGIVPERYICTKKVAKDIGGATNYSMQYLRYLLNLDVPNTAIAHTADGDVRVLYALYQWLLSERSEEEMIKICNGDNPLA